MILRRARNGRRNKQRGRPEETMPAVVDRPQKANERECRERPQHGSTSTRRAGGCLAPLAPVAPVSNATAPPDVLLGADPKKSWWRPSSSALVMASPTGKALRVPCGPERPACRAEPGWTEATTESQQNPEKNTRPRGDEGDRNIEKT